VDVVAANDPEYTAELIDLSYSYSSVRAAWDRIVERAGAAAVGLWVPGRAVGFTAVSEGISSVFSVAVREVDRRTGLATAIMSASSAWALEQGAEWQFVQVLGTNAAAIELYEGLGFTERYCYSYLQPTGER
jgi:GNAT superfamily N-acetyltransferase